MQNICLIFLVFGIIFLGSTTGAPLSYSDEEFIESGEDDGVLAQEVEESDEEIYGEDSFDEFREEHPDDVDEFVSKERPHPGDDLVQDQDGADISGNHGQENHQDEEGELPAEDFDGESEDYGVYEDEAEGDGENWEEGDSEDYAQNGSLEEGDYPYNNDEDDDEWDEDGYNGEDKDEEWYEEVDDNDENIWSEEQNGDDEGFGVEDGEEENLKPTEEKEKEE